MTTQRRADFLILDDVGDKPTPDTWDWFLRQVAEGRVSWRLVEPARTDAHKCAKSAPDMTDSGLQRPDTARSTPSAGPKSRV